MTLDSLFAIRLSLPVTLAVAATCIALSIVAFLLMALLWSHEMARRRDRLLDQSTLYSKLLPTLAADAFGPILKRLYVKSILLDVTMEELIPEGELSEWTAPAREARRLFLELQAGLVAGRLEAADIAQAAPGLDAHLEGALFALVQLRDKAPQSSMAPDGSWDELRKKWNELTGEFRRARQTVRDGGV